MKNICSAIRFPMVFLITVQMATGCMTHKTIGKVERPEEYVLIEDHQLVRVLFENEAGETDQITGEIERITDVSLTVDSRTINFDKIQQVEILDEEGMVIRTVKNVVGVVLLLALVAGAAVLYILLNFDLSSS